MQSMTWPAPVHCADFTCTSEGTCTSLKNTSAISIAVPKLTAAAPPPPPSPPPPPPPPSEDSAVARRSAVHPMM